MVNLAGFEPATFCVEDRRSDSAELQARDKSNVERPMSNVRVRFQDFGPWTLDIGRGLAGA